MARDSKENTLKLLVAVRLYMENTETTEDVTRYIDTMVQIIREKNIIDAEEVVKWVADKMKDKTVC